MRILITGGSGFIGTNLAESYRRQKREFISLDFVPPKIPEHNTYFKKVDIRDGEALIRAVKDFAPTHIVHLAARADLDEKKSLAGYNANMEGVQNLIQAISQTPSVRRCVFASTKLVVPNGSAPSHDLDYRPDTLYGVSKAKGEQIVLNTKDLKCEWCIIRPSSIWGPWSDAPYNPYGKFFFTVAKGRYFHPGNLDPPRSYGYVGNVIFQIEKLLISPVEMIQGKVFYLADYEVYHIKPWADLISRKIRGRPVWSVPMPLMRLAAWVGDLLKMLGMKNPLITSFRLRNMGADTAGLPLEPIRSLTGPLPYTIEKGVDETITWLRRQGTEKNI